MALLRPVLRVMKHFLESEIVLAATRQVLCDVVVMGSISCLLRCFGLCRTNFDYSAPCSRKVSETSTRPLLRSSLRVIPTSKLFPPPCSCAIHVCASPCGGRRLQSVCQVPGIHSSRQTIWKSYTYLLIRWLRLLRYFSTISKLGLVLPTTALLLRSSELF